MRVVFCGGGTAGHITPAISIAESILIKHPDSKILFIGRAGGDENHLITHCGFDLKEIEIHGIKRSLSLKNLELIRMLFRAIKQSKEILKHFNPNVVIGTGGYVSWPVLKAAQSLKIPTIIHESNAYPGLTTRILASKCDKVLINFPESKNHLKNKSNVCTVGNPIRRAFFKYSRASARKELGIKPTTFFILSLGGSGGSEIINQQIITLMKNYSQKLSDTLHIHACGKRYFEEIKKKNAELIESQNGTRIIPFIENMALYATAADIIICRCGAMTLSEISKAGCVPILIPSPNVTDNHQYKNGKVFSDKGAAILLEESELTERSLTDAVKYLKREVAQRKRMASKLSTLHNPNCLNLICQEIEEVTSN